MIVEINSSENKKVKEAQRLKMEKYRTESPYFLIEGFHILEMAIKANRVMHIFAIKKLLNVDESITQYIVNQKIIDKLSFMKSNQGVVAVCKKNNDKFVLDNHLVYLENIKDPGNLGTILRTSLAFGIKNVLISDGSVSIYNEKVLMASQGAIFSLNVKKCDIDFLKEIKKQDYKIISSSLESNSISLNDFKISNNKCIIVFGNETNGISDDIKLISDEFIKIPISEIDSLNVAIAYGIIIYHLFK